MLLVFYLFINTTSSVEDRSCSDSTIIYTVLILHFHSVCANKRSMHLSYWCSYGFSGDPSSIKMARVGRGSDEDQQQCPCAEKIKTSVLILQTANQLENSQPQPLISIIPKKINQHSNSSQRNPGFGANLSHFPREVSSNCWEPQVTG